MSLIVYSTCRIQFMPKDTRHSQRDYSNRSLIELRADDDGQYSLRGVDVEHNRTEIFKFQLVEGLYKCGSSFNNWDEIRCQDGTYRLWLSLHTEDTFHKELRQCSGSLPKLKNDPPDINLGPTHPNELSKWPTNISDQENILLNIHKLGQYIVNGNVTEATELASKLARKGTQLKFKTLNKDVDDEKLRIRVKLDRIDPPSSNTNEPCTLNVYRSTTIHELRALFELACGFPSENQYFFVNGHLAYKESTMEDLKVEKNSLFVLFLIEEYKKETRL